MWDLGRSCRKYLTRWSGALVKGGGGVSLLPLAVVVVVVLLLVVVADGLEEAFLPAAVRAMGGA